MGEGRGGGWFFRRLWGGKVKVWVDVSKTRWGMGRETVGADVEYALFGGGDSGRERV